MYFGRRFLYNPDPTMAALKYIALLSLISVGLACCTTADSHLHCAESDGIDCSPLYPPSFDEIYANTLMPKCAIGGTSCHGDGKASSGLDLSGSADAAYSALMNPAFTEPYISPGDIHCGHLIYHLESTKPGVMMPPGAQLSAEERCAIRKWIASGAQRIDTEKNEPEEEPSP